MSRAASDHPAQSLIGSHSLPINQSDDAPTASRPRPSIGRRRDKPQLSCNLCRRRKLRCDRQQPCATCSSYGQTCTYPEDSAKPPPPAIPGLHDRLMHLERLVKSLASKSNGSIDLGLNLSSQPAETPLLNTPVDSQSDAGSIQMIGSEVHYVNSDHWAAILDGIADLKDRFDREEQFRPTTTPAQIQDPNDTTDNTTIHGSGHSGLLYGKYKPASRVEILAALPPKGAVDRYISRYFNRMDLVSSSIHGPTFLHEYEAFWTNPSSVPIMWIGLLYSMMCLAVLASDEQDSKHGSEKKQQSLQVELFREKVVQSLILGEYTKSAPNVLVTMIHYVYIEFAIRTDADKDIWYLLALEINLAMRMGYHLDPNHFPCISPLKSEMRRRIWATVLQGDILISGQMGMPRMISDWQCDTAEPQNLNDSDLDQDTPTIPPSRPETEITTTLGTIARRRMLMALGTVSDLMANVKSCNYAEVMHADGGLHKAAASIPQPFKMKSMTASITDSPQVLMSRLFINHLFYRGKIMLHRRFVLMESASTSDGSFLYSHKACLDACIGLLHIQNVLDEETAPGGQLHMMRWRVSSIVNHHFLTATMILCSLLHRGQVLNRKEEIMTSLQNTGSIWMRSSTISPDARKAAETINFVLAKAGEDEGTGPSTDLSSAVLDGQTMSIDANGGGADLAFNSQGVLQYPMDLYELHDFIAPGLSMGLSPPPNSSFNFNDNLENATEGSSSAVPEAWMMMTSNEMFC